jgi:hypothetical protein
MVPYVLKIGVLFRLQTFLIGTSIFHQISDMYVGFVTSITIFYVEIILGYDI